MNSIFTFILIFALLTVFRHGYFFIQSFLTLNKYVISDNKLIWLGLAISYILTFIIL